MALLPALKLSTRCPQVENLVMTTKANILSLPSSMSNSLYSLRIVRLNGMLLAENAAAPVGVVNTALCSLSCLCTVDGILGILSPVEKNRPFLHTKSGQLLRCLVSDSELTDQFSWLTHSASFCCGNNRCLPGTVAMVLVQSQSVMADIWLV